MLNASFGITFQSTLSVRRATQSLGGDTKAAAISIHALRKESDCRVSCSQAVVQISIHALRKESDASRLSLLAVIRYFNPRSP